MYRLLIICGTLLTLLSCGGGQSSLHNAIEVEKMEFSRYLTIAHFEDHTLVEIKDPWDSTKLLHSYALIPHESKKKSGDFGRSTVVKVPLQRAVMSNSVHTSAVVQLGAIDRIAGICEVRYIESPETKSRIQSGVIANIGEATSPNIEKIIDIRADAIVYSPFKDAGYGVVEKLRIPIIEGADYMEQHPLGRVEWVKFYGLLFGVRDKADSLFNSNRDRYLALKKITKGVENRPTVMVERRYKSQQWYVLGGNSYGATLLRDAGADYIFSYLNESGNVPLSFETVLDRCIDADFWLLKYSNNGNISYSDLAREYEPYKNFKPFKNRSIYGCNTDDKRYYEETPIHPHLLLEEYIYIFHPELLPDFKPFYFAPLIDK